MFQNETSFPPLQSSNQDDEHRKNDVLHKLLDVFLSSIDVEVILTVLESCNYNYEKSKEALRAMRSGDTPGESRKSPLRDFSQRPKRPEHHRCQNASLKPPQTNGRGDTPHPSTFVYPANASRVTPSQENSSQSCDAAAKSNRNASNATLERIEQYIKENSRILVLMRGCSGSGKSHLANQLLQLSRGQRNHHVFSSDDYFIKGNGKYIFNPEDLPHAHKRNQDNVLKAVRNNISPIIVDNTNTRAWEMQVYVIMAVNHGYAVETLEPQTQWRFNYAQLVRKNVHNVPPETIRMQLDRYEHGLTGEHMIKDLKLHYPPSKHPPQPARNSSYLRAQSVVQPVKRKEENGAFGSPSGKHYFSKSLDCRYFSNEGSSTSIPDNSHCFSPQNSSVTSNSILTHKNLNPVGHNTYLQFISHRDQFNPFSPEFVPSSNKNSSDDLQQVSDLDPIKVTVENCEEPQLSENIINPPEEFANSESSFNHNSKEDEISNIISDKTSSKNESVPVEAQDCGNEQRERWLTARNFFDDFSASETRQAEDKTSQSEDAKLVDAWGCVDVENQSWEIAPIVKTQEVNEKLPQREDAFFRSKTKRNSDTNTNYRDFLLIASLTSGREPPDDARVLTATSRDINENLLDYNPPVPQKIVVDASSMTDLVCQPVAGSISELLRMFPHVSEANLEALLETCNGDINWASNCLLDTESGVRLDIASITDEESTATSSGDSPNNSPRLLPESGCVFSNNELLPPSIQPGDPPPPDDTRLSRHSSYPCINHQTLGQMNVSVRSRSHSWSNLSPQLDSQKTKPVSPPPPPPVSSEAESVQEEDPTFPSAPSPSHQTGSQSLSREASDESETSSQDGEETLEFVISREFSQQLFSRFGAPQKKSPKSVLSPILRIPESIARQMHYYLVLSQEEYEYSDEEAEEDEDPFEEQEYKIDQQLYEEMCSQKPMSEQEQEDMELATAIYELDLASIYNSKDSMATVLARRLLQENFPQLDPNLLSELMEVQGNSFHRTKQMIQEHYMNTFTVHQRDFPKLPDSARTAGASRKQFEISEKVRLKSEAEKDFQISRIYQEKAKEQNAKREWSAAAVYSQMAMVHKRQHKQTMDSTVARILADNLQSFCPSTLDLHCLLVPEALGRLDLFLDDHILSLMDQPNKVKSLYIITGRGKHSSGGVPKIRPAVLERLSERDISNTLENPGLVKVQVTGRSILSDDC